MKNSALLVRRAENERSGRRRRGIIFGVGIPLALGSLFGLAGSLLLAATDSSRTSGEC
jgi:hypothetical protein